MMDLLDQAIERIRKVIRTYSDMIIKCNTRELAETRRCYDSRQQAAFEILENLQRLRGNIMNDKWHPVSSPIQPGESIPPERRVVVVWLANQHSPFCGYIRYAGGDPACPYFVVYHGNSKIGTEVVAWCDCLPETGPMLDNARTYNSQQPGDGFPARPSDAFDEAVSRWQILKEAT